VSKARSRHRFDMVLAHRGGAAAKRRPNDVRMMSKARSRHHSDIIWAHPFIFSKKLVLKLGAGNRGAEDAYDVKTMSKLQRRCAETMSK
jgi:predicted aldo/keto reductase-like oxidoreductase